jgi:hypothetical protein
MRVRLAVEMSGTRNGVPWPKRGTVVELPDDEAQDMLRAGTARALSESDEPDTAVHVPADVSEAAEKFIPVTARHTPVGGEELLPDEDRRPIMGNIGLTDDGEIAPKYKEGTGLLTKGADVNDTPGLAQSPPALADDQGENDGPVDMTEGESTAEETARPAARRVSKTPPKPTK